MRKDCLIGSLLRFWVVVLHTLRVQVDIPGGRDTSLLGISLGGGGVLRFPGSQTDALPNSVGN